MKTAILRVVLGVALLFAAPSCQTAAKKQQEAIRQTVYATHDSLEAGRVDLGKKYIGEAVRLVPPPKKRVEVKPVFKTGISGKSEQIVILPETLSKKEVISVNTPEFEKLLAENTELKKQFDFERKEFSLLVKNVDNITRKLAEELEKEKNNSKGLWGWLMAAIGAFGLAGTVLLCVFFPPLIPVIMNIFNGIVGYVGSLISNIFKKKDNE